MESFKLKFKPSDVGSTEEYLHYQVTCQWGIRQMATPYHIKDEVSAHPSAKPLTSKGLPSPTTLFGYMERLIARLKAHGQHRTAETYQSALNSFCRFCHNRDLTFNELTPDLLADYESHLRNSGLVPNTVSFYLKRLRATYNKAVEEGLTENRHSFRKISTPLGKTAKRAISLKHIKKVKELELPHPSSCRFARDIFLFSFYTRGMSFVDIALLKKSDIANGILTYRRKKTGQMLTMRWESCMKEIADTYASDASSPYLFSIIRHTQGDIRQQCHNALTLINRHLKRIGQTIGLTTPLTMYVARHSWASIAYTEGIPISVISEGMGHESEKTTRIYLASLETQIIDNANKLILEKI